MPVTYQAPHRDFSPVMKVGGCPCKVRTWPLNHMPGKGGGISKRGLQFQGVWYLLVSSHSWEINLSGKVGKQTEFQERVRSFFGVSSWEHWNPPSTYEVPLLFCLSHPILNTTTVKGISHFHRWALFMVKPRRILQCRCSKIHSLSEDFYILSFLLQR